MQRSGALHKVNLSSVGPISFSATNNEDIRGLEEAVQNISIEAKSSVTNRKLSKPERPNTTESFKVKPEGTNRSLSIDFDGEDVIQDNDSCSLPSSRSLSTQSDTQFELAVDVASVLVGDEQRQSKPVIFDESERPVLKTLRSNSLSVEHQKSSSKCTTESHFIGLSSQRDDTSVGDAVPPVTPAHAPPSMQSIAPDRPQRPPPPSSVLTAAASLKPSSETPVAAADIHALLDSFSTPPKSSTARQPSQRSTPATIIPSKTSDLRGTLAAPHLDGDGIQSGKITHYDHGKEDSELLGELHTDECTYNGESLGWKVHGMEPASGTDAQPTKVQDECTSMRLPAAHPVEEIRYRRNVAFSALQKSSQPPSLPPPPSSWIAPKDGSRSSFRRKSNSIIWWLPVGFVILLLLLVIYWSSTFYLGMACGCLITLFVGYATNYLFNTHNGAQRCYISGAPLGQLCCSLHCQLGTGGDSHREPPFWPVYAPALPPLGWHRKQTSPQFRDLPSPPVPVMLDEDPKSSASEGPLGSSLGFKFNRMDRPVYRGWMNEIGHYDALSHHISQTHSVFVTLDGSQFRLQRPRRNISRRSMWNDELPAITTIRFRQQRIFDLIHSRVTLVPPGLVFKRLWSKKYPIAITIPNSPKKRSQQAHSLSSSVSVPNMIVASGGARATVNQSASNEATALAPSPLGSTDDMPKLTEADSETLYLFSRTCREKEAWYRRLRAASLGVPLVWTPQLAVLQFLSGPSIPSTSSNEIPADQQDDAGFGRTDREASVPPDVGTSNSLPADTSLPPVSAGTREPNYVTYIRYMAKFMPATWLMRGAQALRLNVNHISCEPNILWINALIGRLFWDFLREVHWLHRVRDKLQAKLKKIHLPQFISDLRVVSIDLGSELPVIRRIAQPYLDAHGLWFELDVAYAGGFSVVLETSVNLIRWNQRIRVGLENNPLGDDVSSPQVFSSAVSEQQQQQPARRRGAFCSEEEDSADSTTDSDSPVGSVDNASGPSNSNTNGAGGLGTSPSNSSLFSKSGRNPPSALRLPADADDDSKLSDGPLSLQSTLPSKRRLIRLMDRIARSTYFQKAVDNKLVQRGMEMLSNTPIVLEAEVQFLSGTLLVNIPPPPSDRLWYGFLPTPQLRLKARPRVGEKAVTVSRILEWIENRVVLEFQRLLVLPNMDDISIPLLLSDISAN